MKKLHRAWAVCLGCTLMLLIGGGLGINAFSVTQPYILAQNGFTNTQTSMIITVRSVSILLCLFLTPWYYRLFSYRAGTALATGMATASFVLFANAKSLWVYYLAGALAGFSHGLGSMVPATILMTHWFRSNRALAVGICSAGTGLAAVIFSPVLTLLIERFGLHTCFMMEALVSLAAAVLVYVLVRNSPDSCGMQPYGTAHEESAQEKRLHNIHPSALRWAMLYLGMAFLGAIASPGFAHMTILFTSSGFSSMQASSALSIFGFALMAGKVVYGAVCDRVGCVRTNRIFGAVLLTGIALCVLAGLRSSVLMYLASILYGAGVPLSTVGLSVWATDFSKPEQMANRVQQFQVCYAAGSLMFSFMPGMFADLTGSYAPSYVVFFLFGVFAIAVVQSTYRLGSRAARQGAEEL